MICNNCGANIPDDSVFCENCGTPIEPLETADAYDEAVDEVIDEAPVDETEVEQFQETIGEVEETAEDEVEVPIEELAEEEFREIEELENMEEIEEPEFYDEEEPIEDDFKEIEELEAMDEVEYDEDEYDEEGYEGEYEEEYEYEDNDYEGGTIPAGEIPEEAGLPDLSDLDIEETGQPEGSETEWLESFQQLSPKEEDWPEEPVEEAYEEAPVEEVYEEEPVGEETFEEELPEEPEAPAEEAYEEAPAEEVYEEAPVGEETFEEELPEEPEAPAEEAYEEEPVEEAYEEAPVAEDTFEEELPEEPEAPEAPAEEAYEEEPAEEVYEEAPAEEAYEEEPAEEVYEEAPAEEAYEEAPAEEVYEEAPAEEAYEEAPADESTAEEPAEKSIDDELTEELPDEPAERSDTEEPADEPAAEEDKPDGAEKVSAWLGNLGKSVRTGTGWAVDVAKDKAKASRKKEAKKSDRDLWTEEDEGDLDLGYNFWYKSNQADTSSRYEGMDDEEESDAPGRDDAITYVAVKSKKTEKEKTTESEEGEGTGKKTKKPMNKLKVTVIVLVIAALLGAGGIFGSKSYTENKQEEAYQASLTKAEALVEKKDYPSAEKIYTDLIAEYPDRAELYEALAQVYINEEKYDDAKNTINEGVARTGKSKAFAALSEDIEALTSTEWREPYRRVLADNEWAVKQYDDKNGSCVALCDITGDKRPEMMFFTQEYFGYGKLHIVVYENEKAQELTYDCKNRSTQYQDAFYDIENDESGYIIYKSKTAGKFGIFASFKHAGVDEWSTINRYTLSGTECDRDSVFEACITTSYRVSEDEDEDDGKTKYYKDDKDIKYDTYIKEFTAVMDDIDQVVMTSENTAGDKEIWNRIMDIDEAAMTYSEAMKILDEDAI